VKQINVLVKNLYALEVEDACKSLRRKENIRYLVVEREHDLPLKMEPQKQTQQVVEQPQMEKQSGDRVETSTKVETSSRGEFPAKWAEGEHASISPGVRWGNVKQ